MSIKSEYNNIEDILNIYKNDRKNQEAKIHFFRVALNLALNNSHCFICNYPDVAQELILCYTIEKKDDYIKKLLKSFDNQLMNCSLCIDTYHERKLKFFESIRELEGADREIIYKEYICKEEIKRIDRCIKHLLKILSNYSLSTGELEANYYCAENIIYEVFHYTYLLKIYSINSSVVKLLLKVKSKIKPYTNVIPGVFIFAFHQNDELRQWITSLFGITIKTITDEEYSSNLNGYFEDIMNYIKLLEERSTKGNTRKLFKALTNDEFNDFFCYSEDKRIIDKSLASMIMLMDEDCLFHFQHDHTTIFKYICKSFFDTSDINIFFTFKVINKMLNVLSVSVWDFQGYSVEIILSIFDQIITNEKYQNVMKERKISLEKELFLVNWIDKYIESVSMIIERTYIVELWKKTLFYYRDWISQSKEEVEKYILNYLKNLKKYEDIDSFTSVLLENLYSPESFKFFYDNFISKLLSQDIKTVKNIHEKVIRHTEKISNSLKKEKDQDIKFKMDVDDDDTSISISPSNNTEEKIHQMTWVSLFKRFDLILKNPEIFSNIINIISPLFFIYSEYHTSEETFTNFILNLYQNFIKQLIGHPRINQFYYTKDTVHLLINHILSPHLNLSETSYKLLENVTNKKNRNEAINMLCNTFPKESADNIPKIFINTLLLNKSNDDHCMLYIITSITSFIYVVVINIESDYIIPEFIKSEKFLSCVFNFINIALKNINKWENRFDEDVLMDCYNQLLDTFSLIINSIDNKGENSTFQIIAPELDKYIIPLFQHTKKEKEQESYSFKIIIKILLLYTYANVTINDQVLEVLSHHNDVSNKENYDEFLNLYNIQKSHDQDKVGLYQKSQERLAEREMMYLTKKEEDVIITNDILYEMDFLLSHIFIWRYGDKHKYYKITFKPLDKIMIEFESKEEYIKYSKNLILTRCWIRYLNAHENVIDNQNINLILRSTRKRNIYDDVQFSTTLKLIEGKGWKENDVLYITLLEVKNKKKYTYIYDLSCFIIIKDIKKEKKSNEAFINCIGYLNGENHFLYSYFSKNSRWKSQKIFSIDTFVKEYNILKNFDTLPFNKAILKPSLLDEVNNKLNSVTKENFKTTHDDYEKRAMEIMDLIKSDTSSEYKLNEQQINAIKESILFEKGISLINGHSGTGKSQIIVSIVSALFQKHKENPSEFKILICTPNTRSSDHLIYLFSKCKNLNFNIIQFNSDENNNKESDPRTIEYNYETLIINDVIERLEENYHERKIFNKLSHFERQTIEALINYKKDIINKKNELNNILKRVKFCKENKIKLSSKEEAEYLKYVNELYYIIKDRNLMFKNIYRFSKLYKNTIINWYKESSNIIILEHNISVCSKTTTSLSIYQKFLMNQLKYNVLIMDDADEFEELNLFIPFFVNLDKVILLGNYINREKNWINKPVEELIKESSFFNRAVKCNSIVIDSLVKQYRMNKEISNYFNSSLYDKELLNLLGPIINKNKNKDDSPLIIHSSTTSVASSSSSKITKTTTPRIKIEFPLTPSYSPFYLSAYETAVTSDDIPTLYLVTVPPSSKASSSSSTTTTTTFSTKAIASSSSSSSSKEITKPPNKIMPPPTKKTTSTSIDISFPSHNKKMMPSPFEKNDINNTEKISPDINSIQRYKLFFNYQFYNVNGYENIVKKTIYNKCEVDAIFNIVHQLLINNPNHFFMNKIAILSPFIGQVKMLRNKFSENYGMEILDYIKISTLEDFNCNEIEILIFSCTITIFEVKNKLQQVYILSQYLMKAINSLIIVGKADTLINMDFWRFLIRDAENRRYYTDYNEKSYPPFDHKIPRNIYPFYSNIRTLTKENTYFEKDDNQIETINNNNSNSNSNNSQSEDTESDSLDGNLSDYLDGAIVHEDQEDLNAFIESDKRDRPTDINVDSLLNSSDSDSDDSDDDLLNQLKTGSLPYTGEGRNDNIYENENEKNIIKSIKYDDDDNYDNYNYNHKKQKLSYEYNDSRKGKKPVKNNDEFKDNINDNGKRIYDDNDDIMDSNSNNNNKVELKNKNKNLKKIDDLISSCKLEDGQIDESFTISNSNNKEKDKIKNYYNERNNKNKNGDIYRYRSKYEDNNYEDYDSRDRKREDYRKYKEKDRHIKRERSRNRNRSRSRDRNRSRSRSRNRNRSRSRSRDRIRSNDRFRDREREKESDRNRDKDKYRKYKNKNK
ncbi:hypothetical protein BCR32DRAFT_263938 [Anaeromyces robustus]|uniref:P-loop containing nucleoside triphosphate hydrolase protein n=1 Tax=Anaeromyces robustus TaxID=1754192 RepID=A0A1Y1XQW0_9FUNG|nr:hypothetical protein BCR32DRAFT_263938 [Anaeromyces robustus]|eukprot:ORX87886.1 hypothetical protein BCR32DRAFT_263938 [Anaeromyces robustus]